MTDLLSYAQGGPGYKEPTTSKEAAEKVAGSSEAARGAILSLLWTKPPMSADQIAAHFGWSKLYVRPRVSELHKLRAIRKAGRTTNDSGMGAWLWTVA